MKETEELRAIRAHAREMVANRRASGTPMSADVAATLIAQAVGHLQAEAFQAAAMPLMREYQKILLEGMPFLRISGRGHVEAADPTDSLPHASRARLAELQTEIEAAALRYGLTLAVRLDRLTLATRAQPD